MDFFQEIISLIKRYINFLLHPGSVKKGILALTINTFVLPLGISFVLMFFVGSLYMNNLLFAVEIIDIILEIASGYAFLSISLLGTYYIIRYLQVKF